MLLPDDLRVLGYLVSCYFHEDFDFEADAPLGAVKNFVSEESPEYSQMLLEDLELIRDQGIPEDGLKDLWVDKLGAYYEPDRRDGISYLQWFSSMRDLLRRSHGDAGPCQ
jgi:hypothetical protein